jgi:beta-galactosidase
MLYEETDRMIRAYGNHPSFLLLSPSNEPSGRWKESFDKWIAHYRAVDPRRLYTNGTGHTEPSVPGLDKGTDYLAMQRIGPKPLRNKTGWFGRDYAASLEGRPRAGAVARDRPVGGLPRLFDIIDKFTGYLRPGNYEIFRDSARAPRRAGQEPRLRAGFRQMAAACYKEEIEANLRTRGMSGYQLLDLHDYLGQGTALVGVLDTFWEPKGYATPEEFRRFNGETVPLARLTRAVLTRERAPRRAGRDRALRRRAAGAGAGLVAYRGLPAGKTVLEGRFDARPSRSARTPAGPHRRRSRRLPAPGQYKLVVGLAGTKVANDWNFWVYPAGAPARPPAGVLVTHSWPPPRRAWQEGGKVLYLPRKADLDWTSPPLADVPVFWNRLMNPGWGRMLGLWSTTSTPRWRASPRPPLRLAVDRTGGRRARHEPGPPAARPAAHRPADRRLEPQLQARRAVRGEGRAGAAGGVHLRPGQAGASRPVARQLRRSVLDYMASAAFAPKATLAPEALRAVLFDTRVMKKLGATASGWPDAATRSTAIRTPMRWLPCAATRRGRSRR